MPTGGCPAGAHMMPERSPGFACRPSRTLFRLSAIQFTLAQPASSPSPPIAAANHRRAAAAASSRHDLTTIQDVRQGQGVGAQPAQGLRAARHPGCAAAAAVRRAACRLRAEAGPSHHPRLWPHGVHKDGTAGCGCTALQAAKRTATQRASALCAAARTGGRCRSRRWPSARSRAAASSRLCPPLMTHAAAGCTQGCGGPCPTCRMLLAARWLSCCRPRPRRRSTASRQDCGGLPVPGGDGGAGRGPAQEAGPGAGQAVSAACPCRGVRVGLRAECAAGLPGKQDLVRVEL